MLSVFFDDLVTAIKADDLTEVYNSFDYIPIDEKSDTLFVVVAPQKFTADNISAVTGDLYYDFHAEITISCLAKKDYSLSELYNFMQNKIIPRVLGSDEVLYKKFVINPPEFNKRFQKMQLDCVFDIEGVYGI